MAFGLLTVKPHLGLLLPVALLCGGHWRCMASAVATALVLAGLSLLAFGWAPWPAFVAQAARAEALIDSGAVPWSLMPTVLPALRLAGLSERIADGGQLLAGLIALACVVWAWRRPGSPGLKAAVLCLATFLALPFAYAYDLTLLTLPLFWWAKAGVRRRTEAAMLSLVALLPFLGPGLAKLGLPVSPWSLPPCWPSPCGEFFCPQMVRGRPRFQYHRHRGIITQMNTDKSG